MPRSAPAHATRPAAARSTGRSSRDAQSAPRSRSLIDVQQSHGNQAVGRLMLGGRDTAAERAADGAAHAASRGRVSGARLGPVAGRGSALPQGVSSEIEGARGGGRPLPSPVRHRLQRAFSADLSGVRLHTDERAHRVNVALSAEAATAGRDIFFRRGRYRPEGRQGFETLAHEVAHTLQHDPARPVVRRRIWSWSATRDAWTTDGGRTLDDGAVVDDIGKGKKDKDQWNDDTRVYWGYHAATKGHHDLDAYYIQSKVDKEAFEQQTERRADAAKTLAGCNTLKKLSDKLGAAGYNFSTVPRSYIAATTEFTTFKTHKKLKAGDRAELACRLALRDIADGDETAGSRSEAYMRQARQREEVLAKSSGMVGHYKWSQFASIDSTDFGKWALGDTNRKPGSNSGTMNCWESVLYAAFKASYITRDQVKAKYLEAKAISAGGTAPDDSTLGHERPDPSVETSIKPIEQLLVRGSPKRYEPDKADTQRPLKGDIVVVSTFGNHVMIAEGNQIGSPSMITCWPQHNDDVDTVRRQTLDDFMPAKGRFTGKFLSYRPFWG